MGPDEVLHRCVMEEKIPGVLREALEGIVGGHMGHDATTCKVLLVGLWWPALHTNAWEWVLSCDTCRSASKSSKRDLMPLFPSQP